ncbi:MAG TPA: helix-turn-helix transcriptional regulator, partial [Dehalococcoidales bacterium]
GELEQLLDQVQKTSSIGIIVLDAELNLVYRNTKTLEFGLNVSAGLRDPLQVENQIQLPDDIVQECLSLSESFRCKFHFKPENRHLVLQQNNHQMVDVDIITLPSAPTGNGHRKPYFVVLLEAIHRAGNLNNPITIPGGKLTPKETEIARCIGQGMSNKEISGALLIGLPTVATHVQHIFKKLGVKRRTQLILDGRY